MQRGITPGDFYAMRSRMDTRMGYFDREKTVQASFKGLPEEIMTIVDRKAEEIERVKEKAEEILGKLQ